MKVFFENQFICTKDYYREYYRYMCFKKPIIIVFDVILTICFIVSILSIMFPNLGVLDNNTAQANIATVLIILCIQIYLYINNVNLEYNRELEKNKGNCTKINILITENGLAILKNSESSTNIEFKNIDKVIKTKEYYILVTKAKLKIPLKKEGFVKGTVKEFEGFLKQEKIK